MHENKRSQNMTKEMMAGESEHSCAYMYTCDVIVIQSSNLQYNNILLRNIKRDYK